MPKSAAAVRLICIRRPRRASNRAIANGAVSIRRCSEAWVRAMLTSAWRRRSISSSAKVSCGAPFSSVPATTLPTTQNSRPSRPRRRHSKVSMRPSRARCHQSVRRSGCSSSGVATVLMGSPMKSASSPANMRRAERFIQSMPSSPTVTMPTNTELSTARVRSACAASASRARCRSSTSTNEQMVAPAASALAAAGSSASMVRTATCTQRRLPSRWRNCRSPAKRPDWRSALATRASKSTQARASACNSAGSSVPSSGTA